MQATGIEVVSIEVHACEPLPQVQTLKWPGNKEENAAGRKLFPKLENLLPTHIGCYCLQESSWLNASFEAANFTIKDEKTDAIFAYKEGVQARLGRPYEPFQVKLVRITTQPVNVYQLTQIAVTELGAIRSVISTDQVELAAGQPIFVDIVQAPPPPPPASLFTYTFQEI